MCAYMREDDGPYQVGSAGLAGLAENIPQVLGINSNTNHFIR